MKSRSSDLIAVERSFVPGLEADHIIFSIKWFRIFAILAKILIIKKSPAYFPFTITNASWLIPRIKEESPARGNCYQTVAW